MPAGGTGLAQAAAGAFERDNVVALARRLDGGRATGDSFDLGALATSWRRLRTAASREELAQALRSSRWGETGSDAREVLPDVLTLVWLRRLVAVAPQARPWAGAACALIAARLVLVDSAVPRSRVRELVRPTLGRTWEAARDVAQFQACMPPWLQPVFRGIEAPEELWRAEAAMRATVEADGFRLLRSSPPGPGVVLGAIAVLAMDAWRVRAALAAAASGTGSSEVLDAVA